MILLSTTTLTLLVSSCRAQGRPQSPHTNGHTMSGPSDGLLVTTQAGIVQGAKRILSDSGREYLVMLTRSGVRRELYSYKLLSIALMYNCYCISTLSLEKTIFIIEAKSMFSNLRTLSQDLDRNSLRRGSPWSSKVPAASEEREVERGERG